MEYFDYFCVPFILLYRFIVMSMPCMFRHRTSYSISFASQLDLLQQYRGMWFRSIEKTSEMHVRDAFFIYMAHRFWSDDTKTLHKCVHRLAHAMNSYGQVPWKFSNTWFERLQPCYTSENEQVCVVDANAQFIIMVWWLYDNEADKIEDLYLHCQRAWQWLQKRIVNNALQEPDGASWDTARQHSGQSLLTNIYVCQAIRCMELISLTMDDKRRTQQFKVMHDRFMSKWVGELYKSQEALPRILGVLWNMVPDSFIMSFNQQIQTPWIPLWVDGPQTYHSTLHAKFYGYSDKYKDIVWPWIGFLWMAILVDRHKLDIAQAWWTSYMQFHMANTLYDMYEPKHGMPVRRAFLKAQPGHALTLATFIAAQYKLANSPA